MFTYDIKLFHRCSYKYNQINIVQKKGHRADLWDVVRMSAAPAMDRCVGFRPKCPGSGILQWVEHVDCPKMSKGQKRQKFEILPGSSTTNVTCSMKRTQIWKWCGVLSACSGKTGIPTNLKWESLFDPQMSSYTHFNLFVQTNGGSNPKIEISYE